MSITEHAALVCADELERLQAERDYLASALDKTRREIRQALVDLVTDDPISAGAKLNDCVTWIQVVQQDVAELTSDRWQHHGTPEQDAALLATTEPWGDAITPRTKLARLAALRRQSLREHGLTLLNLNVAMPDDTPDPHGALNG